MSATTSTLTLTWNCDGCHAEVGDGAGWVTVDLAAVTRTRGAWQAFDNEQAAKYAAGLGTLHAIRASTLMDLLGEVPWHVYHKTCDPAPENEAYFWDIERSRTVAELMEWWLHLAGKNWFAHTDWEGFIRQRVLPQVGGDAMQDGEAA